MPPLRILMHVATSQAAQQAEIAALVCGWQARKRRCGAGPPLCLAASCSRLLPEPNRAMDGAGPGLRSQDFHGRPAPGQGELACAHRLPTSYLSYSLPCIAKRLGHWTSGLGMGQCWLVQPLAQAATPINRRMENF